MSKRHIETFDFSTLYTNLPLDDILKDLKLLIIKMYESSGSSSLLVSTKRKRAYWSSGTYPANYKIHTVDMLIDALEFVLLVHMFNMAGIYVNISWGRGWGWGWV